MKRVLFVCTHNSARSQMAEGLLRRLFGNRYEVMSAGTDPAGINQFAIEVMKEIGIDISGHRSKSVGEMLDTEPDIVVTVCDNAETSCPTFPGGGKKIHKSFEDPVTVGGSDEEKLAAFRRVRDEIKEWIDETF